jgi:hypothetical protein
MRIVTVVIFISLMCMAHACICQSYEDGFQARGNVLINYTADKYAPPSADIGDPESITGLRLLPDLKNME